MPQFTYPLLNMHFVVKFERAEFMDDHKFQVVQGLHVRSDEAEGKELIHYQNLILKRAYEPDSKLVKWCMEVISHRKKLLVNLKVHLLDANQVPLSGWFIEGALPVAWGVEELHAQETKVLIETIELAYYRFHVLDRNGEYIVTPNPEIEPIDSW